MTNSFYLTSPILLYLRRKTTRSLVLTFLIIFIVITYFILPLTSPNSLTSSSNYYEEDKSINIVLRPEPGLILEGDAFIDPTLPIYRVPGGTNFPKPLPLSNDNPWPDKPLISTLLSKKSNMKMMKSYQIPEAHEAASNKWFIDRAKKYWNPKYIAKGEGLDEETGRPTIINHKFLDSKRQRLGAKKVMPRVQVKEKKRTVEHKAQDDIRRDWVKKAFLHLWSNYKEHSWGHDEIRPKTGTSDNKFLGWGATIIDGLDTLLLMEIKDDYMLAREHIKAIDFSFLVPPDPNGYPSPSSSSLPPLNIFESDVSIPIPRILRSPESIPTFEIIIRCLGGLISAYDLSGDPLMLARATELGDWLVPALATSNGFLTRWYRMGSNPVGSIERQTVLAEVGSCQLEFTRLSQITNNPVYYEMASQATDTFDSWIADEKIPGLFPVHLNSAHPTLSGLYSFGGQSDSYYEYLIKMHQLQSGQNPQYERMYRQAMNSAHQHLIKPISSLTGISDMVTIGDLHWNERVGVETYSWHVNKLDHLTCFAGGMLALGSKLLKRPQDLVAAKGFTDACIWAYDSTRSGLSPESITLYSLTDPGRYESHTFPDGTKGRKVREANRIIGAKTSSNYHIQRPETIESVLYLYRTTGDRSYQDKGWKMFTSWVENTIVPNGFAHVVDVTAETPTHDDAGVESFVYAETLKYYYLLFSAPELLSFDQYVFNTEAHPFRIPNGSNSLSDKALYWENEPDRNFDYSHELIGKGTNVQRWVRLMQSASAKGWTY